MPSVVLIWIWFCAYLNCAGWALSAVHQLNACGYAIALTLWFIALFFWRKKTSKQIFPQFHCRKFQRRFQKPFPLAFLILAAMAFLGGAIYAPTNYDALAYRIPRVLHWLAANQWHWIHTVFDRVNDRSCGIEWVSAPFIAFFKTDRFLFLINFISFVFLPGLVFSVFTRLGVRWRVAWHWMWIVPTGCSFVLQAGSIGNDLFGATFALAAVDFALRAKISQSPRDFFTSILAAAMMTSAKTSSLPLLLPWAIAIFPSLRLLVRWPSRSLAVCVLAVFASALPTMVLNQKFSGDWSGAGLNRSTTVPHAAVLRTGANVVLLTMENFVPPVFPEAEKWNQAVEAKLPPKLEGQLAQLIEWPGCKFQVDEMQIEENCGLGFGVSAFLLASAAAGFFPRRKNFPGTGLRWQTCIRWSSAISLMAVLMKSDLSAIARIFTPYYALLIPILLAGSGQEQLLKKCWWRAAAFAVFLIAAGLLIISPARPLFPVMTILGKTPDSPARVREVYTVYSERNDGFAPVRALLPPDLKILGLITYDDPETSLWRPLGSRRIEHVCPQDTAADLRTRGVEYILAKGELFGGSFPNLDDWLKKMNAQIVQKIPLNLRAKLGPLDWYLVKLN
jgi:hypothetical protein